MVAAIRVHSNVEVEKGMIEEPKQRFFYMVVGLMTGAFILADHAPASTQSGQLEAITAKILQTND